METGSTDMTADELYKRLDEAFPDKESWWTAEIFDGCRVINFEVDEPEDENNEE
jgi:uncharacterized iron-regulated membrane protein